MADKETGPRNIFVGREKAVKDLYQALDDAEASTSSFFMISGEAGIGKTALAREALDQARKRDWTIMTGECMFGEEEPYFPIIRAIQGYLDARGGSGDFRESVPAETPGGPVVLPVGFMGIGDDKKGKVTAERARSTREFKLERDRMFENVSDFLAVTSKGSPVLFFF